MDYEKGGVIIERKLKEKNYCTEEVGRAPMWRNESPEKIGC